MRAKRIRLTVGSTHTLLKPTTVYVVTELRRVPNKRGTTSTIPVWRGRCKRCGEDFDFPRVVCPSVRQCDRCRKRDVVITGGDDFSADVSSDGCEREDQSPVALAANAHRGVQIFHEPVSTSHTKPVFTDR